MPVERLSSWLIGKFCALSHDGDNRSIVNNRPVAILRLLPVECGSQLPVFIWIPHPSLFGRLAIVCHPHNHQFSELFYESLAQVVYTYLAKR
jgi:hypothetical protein